VKVRFRHGMAGADHSYIRGGEYDLPEIQALALIAGGAAELVDDHDSDDEPTFSDPAGEGIDTAARRQPETTARRRRG